MIGRAAIALCADHVLLAEALPIVAVAVLHSALVAHAATAILSFDGVTEVTGCAQIARLTVGVIKTLQALAGDAVAGADLIGVDVAGTLARLAVIVEFLGVAVKTGGTSLAASAIVSG